MSRKALPSVLLHKGEVTYRDTGVSKKAIRIVRGVNYRDHTIPLFIKHKILPIKENS